MATQKTIAIIGASSREVPEIVERLARSRCRLLLLSENVEEVEKFQEITDRSFHGGADIITVDCPREASWEADIVVVSKVVDDVESFADRVREVTVGKTVVIVSEQAQKEKSVSEGVERLAELLPHSSVVQLIVSASRSATDKSAMEARLIGSDSEALEEVSQVLSDAGLKIEMAETANDTR